MPNEDAELVGLIDNELDQDAPARLLVRLTEDEALCKRYGRAARGSSSAQGAADFFCARKLTAGRAHEYLSPPGCYADMAKASH
jgi:hypothetical protein